MTLRLPVSDVQLEQMIARLDEMTKKSNPSDGKGKFLGDGLPSTHPPLRTAPLAGALAELLAIRKARAEAYSNFIADINGAS